MQSHQTKHHQHQKKTNHHQPTLFIKVPISTPEQQTKSSSLPPMVNCSLPELKEQQPDDKKSVNNNTPIKSKQVVAVNKKNKYKKHQIKRRKEIYFTQLPCELLVNIMEYLEMNQFIHILLLCKTVTSKLNENSQFYKLLLIRSMEKDISIYGKYLEERILFNTSPFSFDIKSTCFKARGVCQWKHLIEKRRHELGNHLNKKRQTLKDWKKVYEGYMRRSTIENIMFKVETISKACWKNDNSLILILKLITQLREQLLKLDPELRKYIVQRNYGKRIKRGHSLFHQIVYLLGNYSFIRYDNVKIQPFFPYLKFLIGCFGSENPLFTRNSYNYSGMDYVLRVGNYSLISDIASSYSDQLNKSDLTCFVRKPLLFSMIKHKISTSVIKNWIQRYEFPKSTLLVNNHQEMNILHYLCHFVFKYGTQDFAQYLSLLKSELTGEELLSILNQKDDLAETPMSKLLTYCEHNQRNARVRVINWKNLNRLYGIVNMMSVHLGYDMSDEELRRWNCLLETNDATFGNSYSRLHLTIETIDLLRRSVDLDV